MTRCSSPVRLGRTEVRTLTTVGLILFGFPAITAAQDSASTLRGVVRNETGRPIEYALVTLEPNGVNRQARTDRDGRFSFLGTAPGQRAYRVNFVGYRPKDGTVDVPARGVVDI